MAVNRVPVLKRCRSLGLDPIYLGIDKKSNRELKRANRKVGLLYTSKHLSVHQGKRLDVHADLMGCEVQSAKRGN